MSGRVLPPSPAEALDWQGFLGAVLPLVGAPYTARIYSGSPPTILAMISGTLSHGAELGDGRDAALLLVFDAQLVPIDPELFYDAVRFEELPPRGDRAATVIVVSLSDARASESNTTSRRSSTTPTDRTSAAARLGGTVPASFV